MQQTDVFQAGETVGAFCIWKHAPRNYHVAIAADGTPQPVAEHKIRVVGAQVNFAAAAPRLPCASNQAQIGQAGIAAFAGKDIMTDFPQHVGWSPVAA